MKVTLIILYVSVVTPKPRCETSAASSMFSVTGFLTFSVVAATSLANIISNINNNNNNNNDNNNNENENDNNQISNNTMAGRRKRSTTEFANDSGFCDSPSFKEIEYTPHFYLNQPINYFSNLFHFCPEKYICNSALESIMSNSEISRKLGLFITTISAFILSDIIPTLNHEVAVEIIENVMKTRDCSTIKCSTM